MLRIRRKKRSEATPGPSPEEYFCQGMVAALSRQEFELAKRLRRRLWIRPEEHELEAKLLQEWEKLLETAREVVEAHPGRADNHVSLGMCLQRLGRYAEAKAAYREAIRLEPDEENFRRLVEMVSQAQGVARGRGDAAGR